MKRETEKGVRTEGEKEKERTRKLFRLLRGHSGVSVLRGTTCKTIDNTLVTLLPTGIRRWVAPVLPVIMWLLRSWALIQQPPKSADEYATGTYCIRATALIPFPFLSFFFPTPILFHPRRLSLPLLDFLPYFSLSVLSPLASFSFSLFLYGEYQNREFDGSGWDETVRDGNGVGQGRTHGRTSRRIGRLAPVVRSMHVAPAGRRSSYISYTPFIPS